MVLDAPEETCWVGSVQRESESLEHRGGLATMPGARSREPDGLAQVVDYTGLGRGRTGARAALYMELRGEQACCSSSVQC